MPVAVTPKFAVVPATTVAFCGCAVMDGAPAPVTVSVATLLRVAPRALVM